MLFIWKKIFLGDNVSRLSKIVGTGIKINSWFILRISLSKKFRQQIYEICSLSVLYPWRSVLVEFISTVTIIVFHEVEPKMSRWCAELGRRSRLPFGWEYGLPELCKLLLQTRPYFSKVLLYAAFLAVCYKSIPFQLFTHTLNFSPAILGCKSPYIWCYNFSLAVHELEKTKELAL